LLGNGVVNLLSNVLAVVLNITQINKDILLIILSISWFLLAVYWNKERKLRKENKELKDKLILRGKISFNNGMWWADKDSGLDIGPYCSACYDDGCKKLIHLHEAPGGYICPKCNVYVSTKNSEPEPDSPYRDWIDHS